MDFLGLDWERVWNVFRYNESDPLLFNSSFFFYFFTIFFAFYLLVHRRKLTRVLLFTGFSLFFFYKACGWYVVFILIAAVVDFNLSNAIWNTSQAGRKKLLLLLSIVLNLGLLFFFKYTNFFIGIVNDIGAGTLNPLHLALPVGISFYTFENLSYTLDVYRGHFKPVSSFWDYCFFLSFFPKLMMGPIVRAADFIPQIRQDIQVTREDIGEGLFLIMSGLFRKVIIADYIWQNFGKYIFDDPSKHSGVECLFGVYAFALFIYCDFSGYSDMAIGMARWMGFKIPANFDKPYQSSSITEFWRRWHISLSSWLRDYLYIPLGGNRGAGRGTWIVTGLFFGGALAAGIYFGAVQNNWWLLGGLVACLVILLVPFLRKRDTVGFGTNLNLMSTMLLGGFWHGASWNYLLWGFLHGFALAIDKLWNRFFPAAKKWWTKPIGILITFHFVCFCWVFFATAMQFDSKEVLTEGEKFSKAMVILNQIAYNFDTTTFLPMLTAYLPVFLMMALGFVLHLSPQYFSNKFRDLLTYLPNYARLILLIGFIWLLVQFKQAETILPTYLQF